jgi:4-diphosphocytidyl-2-C-methyl-D-erythritol kinase
MVVFPNAKINIGLDILRKRADGYHDIESVMVPVKWRDILEIVESKGTQTTLTVSGRGVNCPPEKNLVMKAYVATKQRHDIPNVDIYLNKIIPDGAGLGGGSADAAFTIIALNDLFNLGMSQDEMAEIASGIGADCPFFIYNRPMLAEGTGTRLTPFDIDLSGKYILLVKPHGEGVSTAMAYSGVTPRVKEISLKERIGSDISEWQGSVVNDFEESVFKHMPVLSEIKARIESLGATYCAMSGSGSTIYGIFDRDIMSDDYVSVFDDCDCFISRM